MRSVIDGSRPTEYGDGPGGGSMIRRSLWSAAWSSVALILVFASSCSDDSKGAPTKAEVTLEPGVYEVNHPERFNVTQVTTRNLPTTLTANGVVSPDVNRTIHMTSQGSGRVVDLKVRL